VKSALRRRTDALRASDSTAPAAKTPVHTPRAPGRRQLVYAAAHAPPMASTSHVGANTRGDPCCGTAITTTTFASTTIAAIAVSPRTRSRVLIGRLAAANCGPIRHPTIAVAASTATLHGNAHTIASGIECRPRPTAG